MMEQSFGHKLKRSKKYYSGLLILAVLVMFQFVVFNEVQASNSSKKIDLTDEEIAFIQDNPLIITGVDPEFAPYEFIDTDGGYKGITADYLKLIEEGTGLKFDIQKDLTWVEAYDLALAGEIDVLPCVGVTAQRLDLFSFSEVYLKYQRVLFTLDNQPTYSRSDIEDLKIGVQRNSSHNSYLITEMDITPKQYNNNDELLLALTYGEIDGAIANYAAGAYRMKLMGLTNVAVNYVFEDEINNFALAVNKDEPILVSIINKGLACITEEERTEIRNKWIGTPEKRDISKYILGTLAALILLTLFMYWTYKLKKEIKYRKEIEEQLVIAQEEALNASEAKGRFLAHMSHEIRTPLNAITGQTYLLENTSTTMLQNKYIKGIKNASYNLLATINDILDFSKIEAGEASLDVVKFNIDELLDKVSSLLANKAAEKNLGFHVKRDVNVPLEIIGDPTKLEQILINFANNAIKFTSEGEVNIAIRLHGVYEDSCELVFSVTDTGIGISREQQDHLFIPFHQLDSSVTRRFGGTGLGLTICKELAALMGGTIEVESEEGKGSEFTVQLPFGLPVEAVSSSKTKPDFSGLRALIIDADPTSIEIINNYLVSYKFTVDIATSCDRGMSMLHKEQGLYDLIILELNMPGQNSIDVIELANSLEISTIVMSKRISEAQYELVESHDVKHIILKPIIASILFDSVVQCFSVAKEEEVEISPKHNEKLMYGHHVLLVEDHVVNQMIEREILEQKGYTVVVVNNGKEAVDYMNKEQKIEIILMDIHMPIMDGYEATEAIRAFNKSIPIIAMTAVSYEDISTKAEQVGMSGYITKPIDPIQLFEEIEKFVHKNQPSLEEVHTLTIEEQMLLCNKEEHIDIRQGLSRIGHNAELYFEVVKKFYEDFIQSSGDVSKHIKNEDYKIAAELAHKIKGCSGNIGANKLFQSSNTLMEALRNGIEIDYGPYLWEYERDMKGTLDTIKCIMDKLESSSCNPTTEHHIEDGLTVEELIRRMKKQLEDADLDAFKTLEQIGQLQSIETPSWLEVKTMMDGYRFKDAIELLNKISNS